MGHKILSILNYLGVLLLLLLAFLGGVLLYPIIYWLKDSPLRRTYPFWWWFDDEDGLYGAEYWREAKGITKKNWWVSYRWSGLRNPMWNAHTKLIPRSGLEEHIYQKGRLLRDGKEVHLKNTAVFHYVTEDGVWNGNLGDYLSLKHSYIGWSFNWFNKAGKLYWRFSIAKKLFWHLAILIQIGTVHRHIFKIKLKWNSKIYENYFTKSITQIRDTILTRISKIIINY